jgi:hypothetical protein
LVRHLANAWLFVLSLVVGLAVCDAYLQLAEIQTPMETRVDSNLGPTYIPGKRISRFNEGFFLGEANDYGYMGPSVPPRRRNAERRILLLGDSFLLGHTVLPRHHFARTLERLLGEATGGRVQALNFGKADFDLRDMYVYYRLFAGTFDHDLALFFVGTRDLVPSGKVASGLYPVVQLSGGALVVDPSFRETDTYRFYRAIEPVFTRSAVMRLVFNAYKMIPASVLVGASLNEFAPAPTVALEADGARSEGTAKRTPAPPVMPELIREILRALARDPRNVLVVQTDLAPALREELRRAGLPILDLGAGLAELEARGDDPYYWPVTRMRGHWNHAAHQEIAYFLSQELARQGLMWPAPLTGTSPRSGR